ncbi:MAG TPA: hypothetical protein VKZ54_01045, partial [Membranihabitans sp.]|nr:hypothetical protein [Membranihabitans sp.]
ILWLMTSSGLWTTILCQEIPAIITFDRNDYHAGNKNWGFAEDDEGNLYVANTEGILIFNGMNWQMVTLPNHRVPRCIYRGYDGKIYAGGFETIGYIDRTDPSRPLFVEIGQKILKGTEEEIWNITGNENQIMFQSFSLMIFQDENGLELYQPQDNIMFGRWIGNGLYVPRIQQGLYVFENGHERTITPTIIPPTAIISGLEAYGNDSILIATRNYGLFILHGEEATSVQSPLNELLKNYQVNELILLQNGDYALGTIQNGVYITDGRLRIKYHINKTNGLANNSVLSLYQTDKGALCIGLNIGMNILEINKSDLYYYDMEGKLGTVFTSIYYKDRFYAGTNQGVFVQDDMGRYTMIPGSQGQVWSLTEADGDLLCGHNSGTLQLVQGEFKLVCSITGGLHMQSLDDSKLLQSTYNGLILLEKRNGLWQDASRIEGTDKLVDRFVYRSEEVVGLHPYFGLVYYKLDLLQNRMAYRKIFQNLEKFVGNNSLGLVLEQDKILVKIDTDFYEVGNFGTLFPLPEIQNETITRRTADLELRLLKPLNNNSEQNRMISYFPDKNLVVRSIEEGYLKQYTTSMDHQSPEMSLGMEYVLVNHLNTNIPPGRLCLEPNNQNITVQLNPVEGFLQSIGHADYRLTGYDETWNPIPFNGLLEFKQLNHGNYNLEIREENSRAYSLFLFAIYPQWYESWPGIFLYLAVLAVIVWIINRRHVKKLRKETERLRKEKDVALEAERIKAKADNLEHEVAYKSKMLANSAMTMVQKNNMLNELKEMIKNESSQTNSVHAVKGKLLKLIDRNLNSDESWEIFDHNFAEIHEDFIKRFQTAYPEISPGDLRLAAYIRMNMSSKEISPILQISVRSVENKRYRLRKKMNLSPDTNLSEYLMRF